MTQDTATMRQHYTISVTTQRHIFEFPFKSIVCQKGKEKKMKRDETEHGREKKLETTCDDGEAKFEIDAKSLH